MRNFFLFILGCVALFSCSPFLQKNVMYSTAEVKDVQSPPLGEERVLTRGLDSPGPDDIRWRWGRSRSGTEERADDNKMLPDQKESINARKILSNTVEQNINDTGSPAVVHDMVMIEQPENSELPEPGLQADMNERVEESQKEEDHIGAEKTVVQVKRPDHDKYYVQIGAWKNSGLAETMLKNIRKLYPNAYILIENDLHKVRIPGGQTKEEGIRISKDIEKKILIKTFVALNP
jgi:cell division septation protein DedD